MCLTELSSKKGDCAECKKEGSISAAQQSQKFSTERPNSCRQKPLLSESNARISEVVRLDLQQQVVHGHVDHSVPEQEGSLRGEDQEKPAHHLFPRVLRSVIESVSIPPTQSHSVTHATAFRSARLPRGVRLYPGTVRGEE